jgi:hypothetical protein
MDVGGQREVRHIAQDEDQGDENSDDGGPVHSNCRYDFRRC